MIICKTKRLILREAQVDDSASLLELLNEPAWHQFIAPNSIDSIEKASDYIEQKMLTSYREHGFGLWLVATIDGSLPIGICGLLKRNTLPHPDLGFALLSKYWGQGFALEAASASVAYAQETLALQQLLAIAKPINHRSIALLEKLGFRHESGFSHPGSDEVLSLFAKSFG
ncbi:GNAT family N-acetyltransferase [Saccharospirillum sp. HFRX-1]|uniref:GNAT family N-acetyltransferase n=1 Tax=unclassified Saccharospirillum TaxID=2633430 RepID=UPI00371EFB8E